METKHIFKPLIDDKDFCEICGKNFRHEIHERASFVRCGYCGTPWEDEISTMICPCKDEELK